MQIIKIDNILDKLKSYSYTTTKKKYEIIQDNFIELFFYKQNFISLGKKYKTSEDEILSFRTSESNYMLNIKKTFLEGLKKTSINYCSYCGKTPNIQRINERGNLAKSLDIEHFLPKSIYKEVAINIYNWLPVCTFCNQRLKRATDILTKTDIKNNIFHPYLGRIYKKGNEIKINHDLKSFDKEVSFTRKDKHIFIFNTQHSKVFQLANIYLNSQDTFNTFNFIQDKRIKIKNELKNFENLKKIKLDKIKRDQKIKKYKNFFFKNYYPEREEDILKFANGKLKKDLIENIKI